MKHTGFDMQEFVSIVSHDFRAPIRHLRQFSIILANSLTTPTAEQEECAAFIKSSTAQCDSMMAALTQLSQIHTRKMDTVPIDFEALFSEACTVVSARSGCQPMLTSNCIAQKPCMDARHAQILVEELVDNAFKFRHPDVELAIHLNVSNANNQLLVELSDNGMGMPVQFVDFCTTLFKQLDKRADGVGKGLTLVENIARLYHGGVTINASQAAGNSGTTVSVSLSPVPH